MHPDTFVPGQGAHELVPCHCPTCHASTHAYADALAAGEANCTVCLMRHGAVVALQPGAITMLDDSRSPQIPHLTGRTQPRRTSFNVSCPACGEQGVVVALDNLEQVTCSHCNSDTTLEEIRTLIGEWTAFLAWLDALPPARQG